MTGGPLESTAGILVRNPVIWLSGLFAGICIAGAVMLGFSYGSFIPGKVLFLGAVIFPFFMAGTNGCLHTGEFTLERFFTSGKQFYFPVLLPLILIGTTVFVLVLLLSVPLSLVNQGDLPSMFFSLLIGVSIPACIFSLFYDNVAVSEGTKVLNSLGRSREIVRTGFVPVLVSILVSIVSAVVLAFLMMMLWGILLYDKFSAYTGMSYQEMKEAFSGFKLADYQNLLGTDGMYISAGLLFLYTLLMIPFLLVYKYEIYIRIKSVVPVVTGEYDEKGRWYKY